VHKPSLTREMTVDLDEYRAGKACLLLTDHVVGASAEKISMTMESETRRRPVSQADPDIGNLRYHQRIRLMYIFSLIIFHLLAFAWIRLPADS